MKPATALLSVLLPSACGQRVAGISPGRLGAVVVDSPGEAVPIDARSGAEFAAGHIPGAAQVSWTELTGTDEQGYWGALPPQDAAALLGSRGVPSDRPVVVYGSGLDGRGDDGNVYWVLRWLGHPDVRLLDGGWLGWVAGDGEIATGPGPAATDFTAEVDGSLLADTDEVAEFDGVLLDVRSAEEYDDGHIPGAVWLEWSEAFDPDETLRSEATLRAQFAAVGIDADTPVVTYCQRGLRAGHTFMVLDALGIEVSNYVGSWARWTEEGGAVER